MEYDDPNEAPSSTPLSDPKADSYDTPPARQALVKEWMKRVENARKHHEKAFKQMRSNMRLAANGASEEWIKNGKFVVPIMVRYINQAVSQLYAKNPTAVAKRKERMQYVLWDGRSDSLQMAMQSAQGAIMGMAPVDPNAFAIIQEVQAGVQQEQMYDRMAKTLELLFEHYVNEQAYNYKQQIKAAVRRTKVCGVAYLKLGFQRIMEQRPEIMAKIEDATSKISAIEEQLAKTAKGELDEQDAGTEELRLLLQDLQSQAEIIVREGPVLDFPRATEILIDPDCRHLKSLAGARWVAHEFDLTPGEIKTIYDVDIGKEFKEYTEKKNEEQGELFAEKDKAVTKARVYEIWDKKNSQVLTVCDGYCNFLKEPASPDVELERFWPFFPLVFNEIEHDQDLYPPSDVQSAKDIQEEYNRCREGLREHRIAARPWWMMGGNIEEEEARKIANHSAHEIVRLKSLIAGQKITDQIAAGPTAPIDPNLYESEQLFVDLTRTVGVQEANLGSVAGGTATESSIAEQSRGASLADNVDDLDEWLTDIAKEAGHLLLQNVTKETVVEIVGPGAVWPDMPQSRSEVAKDLYLEIRAGSSGRPNRAAELANFERGMPLLLQVPGIKPEVIARKGLELLDIGVDIEEALAHGMPSITAINAIVGKMAAGMGTQPGGNPQSDPNQQGMNGANNVPGPQQNEGEPGGQPSYQAPMPGVA